MKSYILMMALSLFSVSLFGQGPTTTEYKQVTGSKNLEVQFTPFGANVVSINGIRGRMFTSSTTALRLNLFLGAQSNSTITQQQDDTSNQLELKDKSSQFTLNLRPGYEIHFEGTDRLSPYIGAELDLAFQTSNDETEIQGGATGNTIITNSTINNNGYSRFGINAIAGFDYYFAAKLYMGTEIGFGFSNQKNSDIKVESTADGFVEPDPVKRGSTFNLGPNVNAAIRIGYLF